MRCQELNVMLIRILYIEQATIIAAVVCSLIVAGLLKGVIGVGMPVVALPLLSLFIDIKSAAMLLSMPLIFSNLPQALEGGKTGRCLMQLMPASVSLGFTDGHHIRIFRRGSGRHRSDVGAACFYISACKGTERKGVHKGSITVSRRFRRLAGNSSDGQPPVQLA